MERRVEGAEAERAGEERIQARDADGGSGDDSIRTFGTFVDGVILRGGSGNDDLDGDNNPSETITVFQHAFLGMSGGNLDVGGFVLRMLPLAAIAMWSITDAARTARRVDFKKNRGM